MKQLRFLLPAALVCIAFGAFTSGASAASKKKKPKGPNMTALYNAAKAKGENKLTIYNPVPAVLQGTIAAFQKRYPGVSVSQIPLAGLPLRARIKAEKAAGKVGADLINGAMSDMAPLSKSKVMVPFVPSATLAKKQYGLNNQWTVYAQTVGAAVYNTNRVSGSNVPRRLNDIVDPKWRGKTASADLKQLNSGTFIYISQLYYKKKINASWLRKLASNNPTPYPSTGAIVNAVAGGQQDISNVQGATSGILAKDRGAPVGISWFREGTPTSPVTCAVLAGAPNPNLAKLWCAFIHTLEGQRTQRDADLIPVHPRVKPNAKFNGMTKLIELNAREWQYKMPKAISAVQRILG